MPQADRQRRYRDRLRQEGHRRLDLHIPADLWEKFAFILEDGTGQPAQALIRWMSAYARRYLS